MKFRIHFSLFLLFLILSTSQLEGQILGKKRESVKKLKGEVEQLKRVIDSLQNELNYGAISIIDTTTIYDTINPGGLQFLKSGDLLTPSESDSLLSIWYIQNSISLSDQMTIDLDTAHLSSSIPDSIYLNRLKAINSVVPLPFNDIVKNHIIYYTQRIPNRIDLILSLSRYYLPLFEEIFDQYDLPKELIVMAIIESALNPTAVSRANAKGMWQFMYRTALQYNLKIDSFVDERFDPIASCHAAAKYLKDSYAIFGDWLLAIASYNCGPGNVNKAIRRSGSKDFWNVYTFLPRETRGYVPSFVAALYTLNYYKEHQILPRAMELPSPVDTFIIRKPLHFGQISELLGISKESIKDYNPQYIREIIPGSAQGDVLRLPYTLTSSFIDREGELYSYKDSIFFSPSVFKESTTSSGGERSRVIHVVRKGETLSHIAYRYRVRVADLQRWNGVKNIIRPGQRITIYRGGAPATSSVAQSPPTTVAGNYVMYTIRKGDTLWDISKKFPGVTLNQIMRLNGLSKSSKIYPGRKIKIKPA
ncbi:MAG: LysM peptidoglycan-binding domain-containing protein [Bacteroidales bacterium]